jgi:hypothetical protein
LFAAGLEEEEYDGPCSGLLLLAVTASFSLSGLCVGIRLWRMKK